MNTETQTKKLEEMTIPELIERRDKFVERLDNGAVVIEQKRAKGQDVQELEDFWIALLRQYERTCDRIRELKTEEKKRQGQNQPLPPAA